MENKILGFTLSLALLGAAASVQAQTYTTLDNPAGTGGTYAYGISGNNIVGWYANSSGWQLGFLYNGSTYTTLTDPLSVQSTMHGPVPNGNYAYGISGNNTVGLYYWNAPVNGVNGYSGFLYNGSTYTTLSDPLSISTSAQGIDGNNIVGYYQDSSFNNYGFLYNGSTYTTVDDPLGVKGTEVLGVDGNNVVGTYFDSSDVSHGFETTIGPVPEPTTLALAGLGGLGLLLFHRRK